MRLESPVLLIDKERCLSNIHRMVFKANEAGVKLMPHFKTHQSLEVARWFQQAGVDRITVSSIGMAEYFAEMDWQEITVAFPANIHQIDAINELAGRCRLNLLVDNIDTVAMLSQKVKHHVGMFVEIDSGAGRTGVNPANLEILTSIIQQIIDSPKLRLNGLYTHAGHSYQARSEKEIMELFQTVRSLMIDTRQHLSDSGYADLEICMGDTPTCSVAKDFDGIDMISPGNFVFYDVMQSTIGSCTLDEIAVAMACSVVSKNPEKHEVCVHGGAVHFSKDSIEYQGNVIFGLIADPQPSGWGEVLSGSYVKALSQEHGIVKLSPEYFSKVNIGNTLFVLPVHSCLTAESMGYYRDLDDAFINHYAQKNRDKPG